MRLTTVRESSAVKGYLFSSLNHLLRLNRPPLRENTCAVVDPLDFKFPATFGENISNSFEMSYQRTRMRHRGSTINIFQNEMELSEGVYWCSSYYDYPDVVMVVPKEAEEASMWSFVKPFTLGMWCTTIAIMIYTALVVWLLEQKINPLASRENSIMEVLTLIWSTVSTMSLSQNLKIESRLARIVIAIWLVVMSIIVSIYSSNFTLRVNAPQWIPTITITSLNALVATDVAVGYLEHPYEKYYLHKEFRIDIHKLKAYKTIKECAEALSKGPNRGGVAAVLMKPSDAHHFVSKRHGYTIYHISFLHFTSYAEMPNSLGVKDFLGWFIITRTVSTLALIKFFFNLLSNFGTDPNATGQETNPSPTNPLEMISLNEDPEEQSSIEGENMQTMGISNISDIEENTMVQPSLVYIPHIANEFQSMEDQDV